MSTISSEKDVSGYRELSGTSMAVSVPLLYFLSAAHSLCKGSVHIVSSSLGVCGNGSVTRSFVRN
jgi:hypothetical protein